MELPVDSASARQAQMRQLDLLRDDLADVRGEIASVIEKIDALREDLYGSGDHGSMTPTARWICCCCRRRDLRRLEDRLWLRLHQLQEKENELHRQRTAILSRAVIPGAGEEQSPAPRQPPPVSPEAPESPSWLQRVPYPDGRQLASTSTAEDHGLSQADPNVVRIQPIVQAQPRPPPPPQRPPSLRRRPNRPGSAEDTGSGAE